MCIANSPIISDKSGPEILDQCADRACMVKSYIKSREEFGDPFDLQECLMWLSYQEQYESILATVAEDRIAACEREQRLAEAKAQGIQFSFLVADQDPGSEFEESCSPRTLSQEDLTIHDMIHTMAALLEPGAESCPEQVDRFVKHGKRFVYCAACLKTQPGGSLIPETMDAIRGHLQTTHNIETVHLEDCADKYSSWSCFWPECYEELPLDTQVISDHLLYDHFEQ